MSKAKYLRIVGWVELVAALIGIIVGVVYMIGISVESEWALAMAGLAETAKSTKSAFRLAVFFSWLLFIFGAFLAPGLGILFLTVANMCDDDIDSEAYYRAAYGRNNKTGETTRIEKLESKIKYLEAKVKSLDSTSTQKTEEAEEKKELDVTMSEEKVLKNEKKKSDVFKSEKKKEYAIGDKVKIIADIDKDGQTIKKGAKGVIDNRLMSTSGMIYVVILDGSGKSVKLSIKDFE